MKKIGYLIGMSLRAACRGDFEWAIMTAARMGTVAHRLASILLSPFRFFEPTKSERMRFQATRSMHALLKQDELDEEGVLLALTRPLHFESMNKSPITDCMMPSVLLSALKQSQGHDTPTIRRIIAVAEQLSLDEKDWAYEAQCYLAQEGASVEWFGVVLNLQQGRSLKTYHKMRGIMTLALLGGHTELIDFIMGQAQPQQKSFYDHLLHESLYTWTQRCTHRLMQVDDQKGIVLKKEWTIFLEKYAERALSVSISTAYGAGLLQLALSFYLNEVQGGLQYSKPVDEELYIGQLAQVTEEIVLCLLKVLQGKAEMKRYSVIDDLKKLQKESGFAAEHWISLIEGYESREEKEELRLYLIKGVPKPVHSEGEGQDAGEVDQAPFKTPSPYRVAGRLCL